MNNFSNISLNQGIQFKRYQSKILKSKRIVNKNNKEGFTNILEDANNNNKDIIIENNRDLSELNSLQTKFDNTMNEYNKVQKRSLSNSLTNIERTSKNNKYLNKYIQWTNKSKNDITMYVTSQGVARYIPSIDIYVNNCNKNGCPTQDSSNIVEINLKWSSLYLIENVIIPTTPTLIVGTPMTLNESCGNEGTNVYVSGMVNNATHKYIGCYNDKDIPQIYNSIPVMSSNTSNNFNAISSSTYSSLYEAWNAFDQKTTTYWHSSTDTSYKYNSSSGIYEGSSIINVNMKTGQQNTIKGEYLQITLPNINTESATSSTIVQYSISPRIDLATYRSPNTWYVTGINNGQWYEIDYQENQKFQSNNVNTYQINSPTAYTGYMIIILKVGNDDMSSNRTCVQISEFNLYTSSNFQQNVETAMSGDKYMTIDECKQYAINNEYNYFGMQDIQSNNVAKCVVDNDIDKIKKYGDSNLNVDIVPIWASGTSGTSGNNAYLNEQGSLVVTNSGDGIILWNSPEVSDCLNGGKLNMTNIVATYGANCNGDKYTIVMGNASAKATELLQDIDMQSSQQFLLPISNSIYGDTASGCAKSFDLSYQCGNTPYTSHLDIAEGQNMILKCTKEVSNCKFGLMLGDDGNLSIYKGVIDNIKSIVWSSNSAGKQKELNSKWVSINGKFGRNYILVGETLNAGEWIGSNNGCIQLLMQPDGNLVLYTSKKASNCVKQNGNIYGSANINAVYNIDKIGNSQMLQKIAYIDENSVKHEYPSSMISRINDYNYYNGSIDGGDISQSVVNTQNDCTNLCNDNDTCAGYVYSNESNTCWLKDSSITPKNVVNDSYSISGIKKVKINNINSSCNNQINNIDTIQYANYLTGANMSSDFQCNNKITSNNDTKELENLQSKLIILGKQIADKMQKMANTDSDIYIKLNINKEMFNKNMLQYKKINEKLNNEFANTTNTTKNMVEGMQGMNINSINEMLADSNLIVLEENYRYIFWGILTLGILAITFHNLKR